MTTHTLSKGAIALAAAAAMAAGAAIPAAAAPTAYGQTISNSMSKCNSGTAVRVTVTGVKSSTGKVRLQLYNGTKADWLVKGRWINRIEVPASRGTMSFCMPTPGAGVYGIAVRHDANGNGKTDISEDGGAMSNNPSINIFNLGKPSYKKTRFTVDGVESITIKMRYM
ncbi:DUF2141 domain-containing protein [Paraurantiacibacter namhicola]|uniref:DUF2141 domain-containing protein n=1 Tax=Paraurantiacibacter namhicola TaxID=645517 RepID=A0A1C7D5X6_9SPHN|nr:DUF2141 domain-containing protein [Paraurantiacibacter namhicola]ANU06860.1 hypothetical protein A6F65_00537 [Paraurantiacibacter namhicola]